MPAQTIESQGVVIQIAVGSPTSYQTINNVFDFSGPGGQASVIDITNLASTAREKRMGLPDEGQFSFNIHFNPDDTSHQAIRDARKNRTACELRVTFTDTTPTTATFACNVLGFVVGGSVDDVVKVAVTCEINGAVTWA